MRFATTGRPPFDELENRRRRNWLLTIVGPPGAGKSTQAAWLTRALGITCIATGDLARMAACDDGPRGRVVNHYLDAGALVPDRLMVELLRERFSGSSGFPRAIVFDGFPRTIPQAVMLETFLLARPLDIVVELVVPSDTINTRLARRIRTPDAHARVMRRLNGFERDTRPMIERLRGKDIVASVDGDQPAPVVHRSITEMLGRSRRFYRTR